MEARLAGARFNQDELDTIRIGNERSRIDARYAAAREFLTQSLEKARSAIERADLELALARLELTPVVGEPDEARQRLEQILHGASRPDQRDRARQLRIVVSHGIPPPIRPLYQRLHLGGVMDDRFASAVGVAIIVGHRGFVGPAFDQH